MAGLDPTPQRPQPPPAGSQLGHKLHHLLLKGAEYISVMGVVEQSNRLPSVLRTASSAPPSAAASPPAPSWYRLSWPSPDCWPPPLPPPAARERARGRWMGEREVRRRKKAWRGWKESGKGKGKLRKKSTRVYLHCV